LRNVFGPIGTFAEAVQVAGWAIDPDTTAPIPVDLYVDGHMTQRTTANVNRPDVGRAYPASGPDHGFVANILVYSFGPHVVCAYAIAAHTGSTNPLLGCRSVVVTGNPVGNLDHVSVSSAAPYWVTSTGWARDPDSSPPIYVDLYYIPSDRSPTRSIRVWSKYPRYDVRVAYADPWDAGDNYGFTASVRLPAGTWTVCAYAINVSYGTRNPQLNACKVAVVP
ncbi:MAG TPA: hypothetical protein VMT43_03220, partial [Acidimicrobiales bacterium]|nr:hypothetical protein [Acidimicrobiales bacterium]